MHCQLSVHFISANRAQNARGVALSLELGNGRSLQSNYKKYHTIKWGDFAIGSGQRRPGARVAAVKASPVTV